MGNEHRGLHELIVIARRRDAEFTEVAIRPGHLKFEAEGLLHDGQRIRLDQKDRDQMFRSVGAPVGYWNKHGARFQAAGLSEHFDRRDFGRDPKLILRKGKFQTITRGDLRDLPSADVLSAVGEALRKESESLKVSRIEWNDERLEVELVSPSNAMAVRSGDVLHSGISIMHWPHGNEATLIQAFILRLVCLNGMTRRECSSLDGIVRTRKLRIDYPNSRELQLNQIRELTERNWNSLQAQLEALRATSECQANVEELLRGLLQRARISPQEMMPRLIAAWQVEGAEGTRYGAVNALTRVATHDPELSLRQRRVLSALGGLLAFSSVHLCDKCYSVLTNIRAESGGSSVDSHEREDSGEERAHSNERLEGVAA